MFLQTWSGTCWWTGLLLNTKYQTHNLVSAPQKTPNNSSLFCDTFSLLLQKRKNGVHCFSGPPCCLRQYSKRKTLETLAKIKTPQYLRDIIQTMYTGCLYLLNDCDKTSGEVAPNKGLKQSCPLSLWVPFCSLYTNDIDRFLTVQRGAATALNSVQVPHCDYADDIALTSNTAECLQFQLNKFHNYTRFKGLKLNTDKTKVVVFFSKELLRFPPSRTMAHL